MKKYPLLFLIFVCFFANGAIGQEKTLPNSFEFRGNFDKTKTEIYKNSILAASMESYRLRETDVVLSFKEGFECILYSAKTLFLKDIKVDVNSYREEFPLEYSLPVFSVNEDGLLLGEVKPYGKFNTNNH